MGHLRVPQTVASDSKIQTIIDKRDTINAVLADLQRLGITKLEEPQFDCPEVNAEILLTADDQEYTRANAQLLSWYNYVSGLLSLVRARLLQAKESFADLEADFRRDQRLLSGATKKLSKEELNDEFRSTEAYRKQSIELQKILQMEELLNVRKSNIERQLRLFSRNIELKKIDAERERAGRGVTSKSRFLGSIRTPATRDDS